MFYYIKNIFNRLFGKAKVKSDKKFIKYNYAKIYWNEEDENYYLLWEDILKGTNMSPENVTYYALDEKNGSILLHLYDKDKKLLKPKVLDSNK